MKLDQKVLELMAKKGDNLQGSLDRGDAEIGAYLSNEILLGETEFDVDAVIGWSREEKKFIVSSEKNELARLLGYSKH